MNKYQKIHLIIFVIAIFIGGCSTTEKASEVSATYISADTYQGLSCDQLFSEAEKIRASIPGLEKDVDQAYKDDKVAEQVGWWLFAPALLFMDGNSEEHNQLALARGQLDAIRTAAIKAECN